MWFRGLVGTLRRTTQNVQHGDDERSNVYEQLLLPVLDALDEADGHKCKFILHFY